MGTAARLTQEAEGYKARIVAQAEGDSQRFLSVLEQYRKAPQVTRERMYIDAMQQIYGGINKILIDSRSGGNLMYLPLDKLMQLSASQAPAAGAPPVSTPAPAPATHSASDARSRDDARSREREPR